MLENSSQRPLLTSEQEEVLRSFSLLSKGEILKIEAFAGTGKTTTLLMLIENNPRKRFLYLVYNRSMAKEIKKKVRRLGLENVEVYTFHAYAFKIVKTIYGNNLQLKNWKIYEIYEAFEEELRKFKEHGWRVATVVYFYLKGNVRKARKLANLLKKEAAVSPDWSVLLQKLYALQLKKRALDFEAVLYYAILNLRKLKNGFENLVVVVDEAQDINDLQFELAKLVAKNGNLVAVGDKHQSIYGWRGAENQLLNLEGDGIKTLHLTHSFRFAKSSFQEVASNALLQKLKGEKVSIKGAGRGAETDGSRAIIARTNYALINLAKSGEVSAFRFNRDIYTILSLPIDIYRIFFRGESADNPYIHHRWLGNFKTLEELYEYAEKTEDEEVINALRWIELNGSPLRVAFELKRTQSNSSDAIVLTTAHSAKGLEFDYVELADDFSDPLIAIAREGCDSVECAVEKFKKERYLEAFEEINTLYIALTRARVEVKSFLTFLLEIIEKPTQDLDQIITNYRALIFPSRTIKV